MMGMDEITGQVLEGKGYVRQCVRRILKMFKGSFLMHREIGSDTRPYLALPTTDIWMLGLTGEITQSIETLLPAVRITAVEADASDGNLRTSVSVEWQESAFKVDSN